MNEIQKNLAIDSTCAEIEMAQKYSNMIRFVFGNRTFSLRALISAIDLTDLNLTPLLVKFGIRAGTMDFTSAELNHSIADLKVLDTRYKFLTDTLIQSLKREVERLTRLSNNVLYSSAYFQEWEIKINDLPLSTRVKRALASHEIETLNDLSNWGFTEKNLLYMRNLGKGSIAELQKVVEQYGLFMKKN